MKARQSRSRRCRGALNVFSRFWPGATALCVRRTRRFSSYGQRLHSGERERARPLIPIDCRTEGTRFGTSGWQRLDGSDEAVAPGILGSILPRVAQAMEKDNAVTVDVGCGRGQRLGEVLECCD